jgi:hypothetical protein
MAPNLGFVPLVAPAHIFGSDVMKERLGQRSDVEMIG